MLQINLAVFYYAFGKNFKLFRSLKIKGQAFNLTKRQVIKIVNKNWDVKKKKKNSVKLLCLSVNCRNI